MIQYFDWLPQLEELESVDSIEKELAIFNFSEIAQQLFDSIPYQTPWLSTPHKFDFFMFIIHTSGSITVKIDMQEYELEDPYNVVKVAPGQIVSIEKVSADFDAHVMLLSRRFIESLLVYINGSVPMQLGAGTSIEYHDSAIINSITMVSNAIRRCVQDKSNPYRLQVVQHLIMAIFYSSEQIRNVRPEEKPRTNADVLSKEFLGLMKENFRKERQLKFYADKLCITPRYLSRVVKESTGSSAADWIERSVVLEARALLKSTNMTVQQISDELNFPSQTFFGKYFKRRIGMSPKEYRRMG